MVEIDQLKNKANILLFFLRVMSVFAFAGMFSSLLLILEGQYSYTPVNAAALCGTFMGLHYMLPLLGGYLGDKQVNFSKLFIAGHILQMVGACVFVFGGHQYLPLALSCFLAQSTTSSVSQNMFLNWLYDGDDDGRKSAYYWNYSGMNLGFMGALLLSGYLEMHSAYEIFYVISFFLSMLAIPTSLRLFSLLKKVSGEKFVSKKNSMDNMAYAILVLSVLLLPLYFVFANITLSKSLILCVAISIIIAKFVYVITSKNHIQSRKNYITLAVYMGYTLVFYTLYMLIPTFLLLFIKYDVDTVAWGLELPPQWVEIFGSLYIIIATPLCAEFIKYFKKKRGISIPYDFHFKFGVIFAIAGVMFLTAGLAVTSTGAQMAIYWVALNLFFFYTGEIILAPAAQSVVGEIVPKTDQGFFSGTSSTVIGISVLLASLMSKEFLMPVIDNNKKIFHLNEYWQMGLNLVVVFVAVSFVVHCFDRRTKKSY